MRCFVSKQLCFPLLNTRWCYFRFFAFFFFCCQFQGERTKQDPVCAFRNHHSYPLWWRQDRQCRGVLCRPIQSRQCTPRKRKTGKLQITHTRVIHASVLHEGDGLVYRWASPRNCVGPVAHGILVTRAYPDFFTLKRRCQETAWRPYEESIHTIPVQQLKKRTDTPRRTPSNPEPTSLSPQWGTYPNIATCHRPASSHRPGSTSLRPLY